MNRLVLYIILLIILNNCSPIIKTHGYTVENYNEFSELISSIDNNNDLLKEDIFNKMGSPSIIVNDVGNYWLYLLSSKQERSFSDSEIKSQFIVKFKFDKNNGLINHELITEENFKKISFNKDETKSPGNSYGISDQLIDSLTRSR